ncbi:YrdB family protein [Paenibacillus caui]|uniref:YrdB family protein n=1 Tax=Paenibacillus caui TaxID=2873927 RepID=UPI001F28C2F3|nr:YrdB family protein [Paenibacillus caui]
MEIIKYANLAVRFILELCLLASLGYWGFHSGKNGIVQALLGIGTPLLAAVIWGTFLSPKAAVSIAPSLQLIMEIVLFGLAAAALYAAGRLGLGAVLVVAYAVNRLLIYVWDQ